MLMKKNYFLGTLMSLLMLVALPMNAQVSTIVDLYGKYKFTADMTVTDAGKELTEYFSNDCEAVIASHSVYKAGISGIAGSATAHGVSKLDADSKTLVIKNWNSSSGSYWGGELWMSNVDGVNPFANSLGDLLLVYDDEKNITIPDFSLVTVADWADSLGTVVATFTNAKLTFVEAEKIDIMDLSGNWHFTAGSGKYDVMADSELPTEFDMVIAKTTEDNKNYTVDLTYHTYPTVQLNATFDGVNLAVALDSTLLDAENGIILRKYYGKPTSSITFDVPSETVLSLSDYTAIVQYEPTDSVSKTTILQYFIGTAKKQESESDKYDWAGTYKVKVDADNVQSIDGGEYPAEFDMVIEYNETVGKYYVIELFGNNFYYLNQGGLALTVSGDNSKEATIDIRSGNYGGLIASQGGGVYWRLADGTGGEDPVSLTVNEDGTITIGDFIIESYAWGADSGTPVAFYQNVTATKEVEAEPVEITWDGTWTVTGTVDNVTDFSPTFDMVIEYNETVGKYYVVELFGNNFYYLNQGGLALTVSGDNSKEATVDIRSGNYGGLIASQGGGVYWRLADATGGDSPISLTMNEDGTLTIGDFIVETYAWGAESGTSVATYTNVSAVKKDATSINAVEKETPKVTVNGGVINIEGGAQAVVVYDIAGRVEFSGVASSVANLAKGIHIVKVGNNVVKVNVK